MRHIPAPGEAPLPAANVAALLRENAVKHADRRAVLFEDLVWTYAEFVDECRRAAALLRSHRPADGPFHVGVLLDNTPAYLVLLGGAALAGAAVVGLNPTRQGGELARDIAHTDLCLVVTEPRYAGQLGAALGESPLPAYTTRRWVDRHDGGHATLGADLDAALAAASPEDPGPEHDPPLETVWCLVFTSGTSSAPKAVICTQRRMLVTGERMRQVLEVEAEDVGYLSMPLFHSNSLMVGMMPALVAGAAVSLSRRFTASGFLRDLRRYGVTYWNYTGKPLSYVLATPALPDDAENPLRRAYGNEGADRVVAAFAERFGAHVIDAFGPTEGGIGIIRGDTDPPGSLGHAGENVQVVDDDGVAKPRAVFGPSGELLNAAECVGEIVNLAGPGPFEGYYKNEEAFLRATRRGWYWTGDLGYVDDAGFVYFAGRTAEWLRVDGENFPAGPIENAVARHPMLLAAAVFGVPDPQAGDAVMACVVPKEHSSFDARSLGLWLDAQPDLGPKWRPRWLRVSAALPMTPSHKVLHRQLQHEKFRADRVAGDAVWWRPRGASSFVPFTEAAEAALREEFVANGRERFWDL